MSWGAKPESAIFMVAVKNPADGCDLIGPFYTMRKCGRMHRKRLSQILRWGALRVVSATYRAVSEASGIIPIDLLAKERMRMYLWKAEVSKETAEMAEIMGGRGDMTLERETRRCWVLAERLRVHSVVFRQDGEGYVPKLFVLPTTRSTPSSR